MTVKKRTRQKGWRLWMALAVSVVVTAVFLMLLPILSPLFSRAALISAVLSMPEGALSALTEGLKSEGEAPPTASTIEVEAVVPPPPKEETPWEDSGTADQNLPAGTQPLPYIEPDIPKEYRRPILEEDWSGAATKSAFSLGSFWLRNDTGKSPEAIAAITKKAAVPVLEETDEPQVLIYHTHATESFCPYDSTTYDSRYNWRSTDNNNNMVAVGAVLADTMRAEGIGVIHDTDQHDYPSYNGSYANSYRSIKRYLAQYPTIKVVLDVHRDALERDGGQIIKPTATINGEKYAQLMVVSNCDDGTGLLPHWEENLQFAAAFCERLERDYPSITRPILFSPRKYNQQLSNGALLLEFGSHANTLEEAQRTAVAAGKALSGLLLEGKKNT